MRHGVGQCGQPVSTHRPSGAYWFMPSLASPSCLLTHSDVDGSRLSPAAWQQVIALVPPDAVVLELGARYGTTSCALAKATANSGRVVSVEPDSRVIASLLANREMHECNVAVVNGTVSSEDLTFVRIRSEDSAGYAMRTARAGRNATPTVSGPAHISNMAFEEVEKRLGHRIDTVLIDCEGCIGTVDERLLWQARLLIVEEDMPNTITRHGRRGYKGWSSDFRDHGFVQVWRSADTYGLLKHKGLRVQYTAWARNEAAVLGHTMGDACVPFARQNNLTARQLECLPILPSSSTLTAATRAGAKQGLPSGAEQLSKRTGDTHAAQRPGASEAVAHDNGASYKNAFYAASGVSVGLTIGFLLGQKKGQMTD